MWWEVGAEVGSSKGGGVDEIMKLVFSILITKVITKLVFLKTKFKIRIFLHIKTPLSLKYFF